MKILVCGGTYMDLTQSKTNGTIPRLVGGAVLSTLIASHSNHEVHLHTNFSTEEPRITKNYQKMLRRQYVHPDTASKISSPYGRIERDRLIPGANIFETANLITRNDTYQMFDVFVITTDIAERDYRVLARYAYEHDIRTIVVTAHEYQLPAVYTNMTLIKLPTDTDTETETEVLHSEKRTRDTDDGVSYVRHQRENDSDTLHLPEYHNYRRFIKDALHQNGLTEASKVTRYDSKPKPPAAVFIRLVTQLIAAALVITGLGLSILYVFSAINTTDEYDTFVDDDAPVDHTDCGTVLECRELGDAYLDELADYINIQDEPHVFIENRTRTTFIDYKVDDALNLTNRSESEELPVGSESDFTAIWDRFSTIFPGTFLEDVNGFRLFSDGEGNTLAYVEITDAGTTLAVDIRDNENRSAEYRTLIHEFGHIYSLNTEDFEAACTGTDLNCIKEGTVMSDYIERFWDQYGEEWLENSHKSSFEQEAFYNNNITDFHVPYQAVNAKEDYAVTFLRFIIERMPGEDSTQLKDVKLRSFYEDTELVKLRVDILSNLLELEKGADQ